MLPGVGWIRDQEARPRGRPCAIVNYSGWALSGLKHEEIEFWTRQLEREDLYKIQNSFCLNLNRQA